VSFNHPKGASYHMWRTPNGLLSPRALAIRETDRPDASARAFIVEAHTAQ